MASTLAAWPSGMKRSPLHFRFDIAFLKIGKFRRYLIIFWSIFQTRLWKHRPIYLVSIRQLHGWGNHGHRDRKSPCPQQYLWWYHKVKFTPNANCAHFCAYSNKKSTYEIFVSAWSYRCRGTESNCRHGDFQSPALPTELPRLSESYWILSLNSKWNFY